MRLNARRTHQALSILSPPTIARFEYEPVTQSWHPMTHQETHACQALTPMVRMRSLRDSFFLSVAGVVPSCDCRSAFADAGSRLAVVASAGLQGLLPRIPTASPMEECLQSGLLTLCGAAWLGPATSTWASALGVGRLPGPSADVPPMAWPTCGAVPGRSGLVQPAAATRSQGASVGMLVL